MRWHRLGHPVFLVAVATLASNDAVLKEAAPGGVTGKLSDVAGVVVVAWALSVALDRTTAVAATTVGFAVLKVVPGGAELAAPVLGGETLRDPTDLLALAVLLPTWWLLGRAPARRAAATVVPLLGGFGAVLSVTATSCSQDPAIVAVAIDDDGDLLALRSDEVGRDQWLRSSDGDDWLPTATPTSVPTPTDADACTDDGRICVRVAADQRRIERSTDGGSTWDVEHTVDGTASRGFSFGCGRGGPRALGMAAVADRTTALVSYGSDGVLIRQDDGSWDRQAVGDVGDYGPGLGDWFRRALVVLLIVGVLGLTLLALLIGLLSGVRGLTRRRFDPWA